MTRQKLMHEKGTRSTKDAIVSVRMPHALIEELRDLQKINHFMDISDEIRHIIRRYATPAIPELNLIESKKKERLIEELTRIIESLKEEHIEERTDD